MKIILISPLPPPAGGIASWTKRYLETPQAQKNEVHIVNIAVIGNRTINEMLSIFDEIKRTVNILYTLFKKLQICNPDIVHLNTPCSKMGLIRDYLCGKIVKWKDIKLIVHCRCDVGYMVNSKIGYFFFGCLLRLADDIITLNTKSQEFILKNFGRKSDIIANFISNDILTSFHYDHYDKEISDTISNVIYVGHITKLKGCDKIIQIAEQFPETKFKLVGYVSEEIKILPKPENVVFIGEMSKEQVIQELSAADLFIFPTLTEGFPNAVLEAMACGLPIITTDVGAIPDMIEDKGGIIVKDGNVKGFINAIKMLENDKKLRKVMSEWNINKVNKFYSEKNVIDTLFKKYEKVIRE